MSDRSFRVLVVEDNQQFAGILTDMLSEVATAEFDITQVPSLAEATQSLEKGAYDVVLLDLSLPDSDGIDTVLKVNERASETPIVVITAMDDEATAIRAVREGAQDYLIKNQINQELLARSVCYAIERKQTEGILRRAFTQLEEANRKLQREIAERNRAEEKLRESEARYRDLYEEAPVAYFSLGVDGRIRRTNRCFGELVGYPQEALLGRTMADLYADTPSGKGKAEQLLQRFLAGMDIMDEELELRRADGSRVWVSLTVRSKLDAEGQVLVSRSVMVDITGRKLAEEALLENNRRLEEALSVLQAVGKSGE